LQMNSVGTVCASTNLREASTRTKSYLTDPQSRSRLRAPFKKTFCWQKPSPMIRRLVKKLWPASRNESRTARTVILKLKTSEFKILTRSCTPDVLLSSCEELSGIALRLRERVNLPPHQRYRLVGVGLSNFRDAEPTVVQAVLFERQ